MMPIFKCRYCGRIYSGGPGSCPHYDCPGNGRGGSAALAIKWWAAGHKTHYADAFDIPMRVIAQKWVYDGLGEYL